MDANLNVCDKRMQMRVWPPVAEQAALRRAAGIHAG